MASTKVSRYELLQRRDAVKSLYGQGFKPSQIFKILAPQWYEGRGYKTPFHIFQKDLWLVRKQDEELVKTGQRDASIAEFIRQQMEVYTRSLADKDYRTAMETSKNIARARGINVDKLMVEHTGSIETRSLNLDVKMVAFFDKIGEEGMLKFMEEFKNAKFDTGSKEDKDKQVALGILPNSEHQESGEHKGNN